MGFGRHPARTVGTWPRAALLDGRDADRPLVERAATVSPSMELAKRMAIDCCVDS